MRILQVAHAFPPTIGGVESHIWEVSQGLASHGHALFCLVGGEPAVEQTGGVLVERRPELTVRYLLAARRGFRRPEANESLMDDLRSSFRVTIRSFRPDIIHVHNAHHFAPELASALLQAARETPSINSVHDRVGEHLFREVLALPWALVIYASKYLRDALAGEEAPSTVRWLGIDHRRFSAAGSGDARMIRLERPVVFHPARLVRWKGVLVGVEAFAQLFKELGRGSLVLCASSNIVDDPAEVAEFRQEVTDKARCLGIGGRLYFLEFTPAMMPAAYRACDLVWYPTIDEEPFGLVPLEAMACCRPVIVTDSGGMRETVQHLSTGVVVPKHDPEALKNAARLLLHYAGLRRSLVRAARRHAEQFGVQDYLDDLEQLYRAAVTRKEQMHGRGRETVGWST